MIDFMGRPAATNYGLALMALKTGTPVVPAFLIRDGEDKYRCIYGEPICLQKGNDRDEDIRAATIRFTGIIEELIRKYPEQWFWLHNRWKLKGMDTNTIKG